MSSHTTGPLSREQERIWRAGMLQADAAYNIASGVRIHGAISLVAVAHAVEHVMRRHASLRSFVVEELARPVVKVTPTPRFPLLVVNLTRLDERSRARWTERLRHRHAARLLPSDRPPLVDGLFLASGAREGYLSCVIHHLVADSWSMVHFFSEFARLYPRFVAGREPELAPIQFGYFDYARWQSRWLASEECARQGRFWDQHLSRRAFRPVWETSAPPPGTLRPSGGVVEMRIPRAVRNELRRVERKWRVTLFMLLAAALHLAVQKWTGEPASRIATGDASRRLPETEPLIGLFANLILLEAHRDPADTVAQFVQKVRDTTAKAIANRDYPFGMVLGMLASGQASPIHAVFQVALVLQGFDVPRYRSSTLSIEVEDSHNGAAKFPLTISARDQAGEIRLTAEYSTERFDAISARARLAQYATLLRRLSEDPEAKVVDLVAASVAERHWAIHEVNDTHMEVPAAGLLELIEANAAEFPDRIAVQDGSLCLTFGEVLHLAAAVGRDLEENAGAGHEPIGLLFEPSAAMVVAILGVMSAGFALVPLDPDQPMAVTRRSVEKSGVTRILCRPRHADLVWKMGAQPGLLDDRCRLHGPFDRTAPPRSTLHPDAMYVIFTSGSPGEPKGVVVPRRGTDNRIAWMRAFLAVNASDRVLLKSPIGASVSMWEILLPLSGGCTVVAAGPADHRESRKPAELIVDQQITIAHVVPSIAITLAEEAMASSCRSLRHVVLSGEPPPASFVSRLSETVSARVHSLYGPAEASSDVVAWTAGARTATQPPIGRPIWNMTAHVLDERLAPVPPGVEGALYLGGAGLALGYVSAPALTAAAFVPNPLSPAPGARLYRTGDRARVRPDGRIDIIDRPGRRLQVDGVRIELRDIEETLRRHPWVADAAAVPLSSPGAPPRIECCVVLKPGTCQQLHERLDRSEALLRFLREELSCGAALSSVVLLERFPLLPGGTPDRQALARLIETGEIHSLCGTLLNQLEEMSDEDAERLLACTGGPPSS
ncbi:MAG: non-ribosomal peptide synthetase [Vicinamibacterales bacterium]